MVTSMYYEDKRKEELFGRWLDKHFYSRLKEKYKYIERNNNEELQKKGVDVIIETFGNRKIYVDEKAALHYINKGIPTFAFEIKNTSSGAQGWLYDPEYMTDYYLLAWPNATDDRIPDEDSFIKTEIMCIKRAKVIQLLNDKGVSESKIYGCVERHRREVNESKKKFMIADKIMLHFNTNLKEKPINVVIRKELLKEYADCSTIIP